ncbi:hypothetical protein WMZ97_18730 [Lentibacillus sp. N15]|uniref:hypothetical protein n=1 Tax=Lentibacillus songyuanensis TaxID=3136161 RepID=UPI0031B9EDC7
MKINQFLIQFATLMIIIFGDNFIILISGLENLQIIVALAGVILLIASLIWRKTTNKYSRIWCNSVINIILELGQILEQEVRKKRLWMFILELTSQVNSRVNC